MRVPTNLTQVDVHVVDRHRTWQSTRRTLHRSHSI
jgi:hypothetical protein